MNWGKSIIVAFILFGTFIGYMVVRAFQENFDLVTDDYYAQEINYQQKLDRLSAAALDGQEVEVRKSGGDILLIFPSESVSGSIQFYHPSRKIFDRVFNIETKEKIHTVKGDELVPGNYRVNISWQIDGRQYYQESKLYVR